MPKPNKRAEEAKERLKHFEETARSLHDIADVLHNKAERIHKDAIATHERARAARKRAKDALEVRPNATKGEMTSGRIRYAKNPGANSQKLQHQAQILRKQSRNLMKEAGRVRAPKQVSTAGK